MPKKLIPSEMNLSEIYPDPLGRAKGAAITNPLTDIALAGDIPASRLFSNLPAKKYNTTFRRACRLPKGMI